MPLLAVILAALTATSVSKKTMESSMHASMTPNLLLIRIKVQRLKAYVCLIAWISFHVVKIHQGSRSKASQGRVRRLILEPTLSWLKYAKLDHASTNQKG